MNNNIIYSAIAFISGAAIAAVVAWKVTDNIVEKKYAKIAQEEIDSVKAVFTVPKAKIEKKEKEEPKKEEVAKANTINKPSLADYAKRVKEYTNYSASEKSEKSTNKQVKPFVISPDEYGEDEEYDQVELTFYADGILANEDDEILEPDEFIGKESLNHIGEYEDDAVHVKNEALKIYYEVLVDERSYEKATGKTPHLDKDEED